MISIPVGGSVVFNLVETDASGHPGASLASEPVYTSSDPSVFTAAAAPGGLAVSVSAVAPGTATLTVRASSAASPELTASLEITVTAGPAVSLALVPVTPPPG